MRPALEALDNYLIKKKIMGEMLMENQPDSMMKKENLSIFEKEWSFSFFNS